MCRPVAALVLAAVLLTAHGLPAPFYRMPRLAGAWPPRATLATVPMPAMPAISRFPDDAAYTAKLTSAASCVEIPELDVDPTSFCMLHVSCAASATGQCVVGTMQSYDEIGVRVGATETLFPEHDHVYVIFGASFCLAEGASATVALTCEEGW